MPGLDKTGPIGKGPLTGGGSGRCNSASQSNDVASDTEYGAGRGGLPRGGGNGWCSGGGRGRGRRRGGNMGRGLGNQRTGNVASGLKRDTTKDTANSETRIESLERDNEELRLKLAELEAKLEAETR
ncbi:MAG: hypothetical protein GY847_07820 [Proteobacteria bacterium]|nr:hypothetical protein [Pseudomonadota bacterium]